MVLRSPLTWALLLGLLCSVALPGGPAPGAEARAPTGALASSSLPEAGTGLVNGTLCLSTGVLSPGNDQACPSNVDPYTSAFDSTNGDLYLSASGTGNLAVVSGTTDLLVTNVSAGATPHGVAFDAANGDLYVADTGVNEVTVVSGTSNSVVTTVLISTSGYNVDPLGVAYDTADGDVYVSDQGTANVTLIDGATNQVLQNVRVGTYPAGIAYDPANRDVYVVDSGYQGDGNISVLSGSTVVGAIPLPYSSGGGPAGVVYDPVNGDLYVTGAGPASSSVAVINASSEKVLTNITAGGDPDGGVYDPATGDVYVSNEGSGNVSVIDGATQEVVGTLAVGTQPAGASYDSSTQAVYVANAGTGTLSIVSPVALSFPPRISSFSVVPTTVDVGSSATFTLTATGGTGTLSYAYTGLPTGCASADHDVLSCTPSAAGTFTVRGYVNDSAGHSVSGTTVLTVAPNSNAPTISSFTAGPPRLTLGGTTDLNVTASGGTGALTYSFSGLPSGCASADRDTLACTPTEVGTFAVRAYVNDSASHTTSDVADLTVLAPSLLSSVVIDPSSQSLTIGTNTTFTAVPTCTGAGGTCPSGLTFTWSLNSSLASLKPSTGETTTLTAGATPGVVRLTVTATANGITRTGNATVKLTPRSPGSTAPPPAATFLGLPGVEGYALIGLVALVAIVVLSIVLSRRAPKPKTPDTGSGGASFLGTDLTPPKK